jgi:hypothetical protein
MQSIVSSSGLEINSSCMDSQEQFSAEDRLQLIQNMIEKTRQGYSDRSHYFLIWGWGAFIAFIAQYILKVVFASPYYFNVWWVTVVCIVLSIMAKRRDNRKIKVKTYINESMSHLWIGLGISFFVISLIFARIGWQYSSPFFILLYALGTFISGRILEFRPFVIGGIICWVLAVVSAWFSMDNQMLFAAAAILVSYIIPAYMIKLRYHKNNRFK